MPRARISRRTAFKGVVMIAPLATPPLAALAAASPAVPDTPFMAALRTYAASVARYEAARAQADALYEAISASLPPRPGTRPAGGDRAATAEWQQRNDAYSKAYANHPELVRYKALEAAALDAGGDAFGDEVALMLTPPGTGAEARALADVLCEYLDCELELLESSKLGAAIRNMAALARRLEA